MISAPSTIDAVPTWARGRRGGAGRPAGGQLPQCGRLPGSPPPLDLQAQVLLSDLQTATCLVGERPAGVLGRPPGSLPRLQGAHSVRYPLVEAANALSFGLVTAAWHGTATAVSYCLLASTLLTIVLIDLGSLRAPLALAAVGTAVADLALIAASGWTHHWSILIGPRWASWWELPASPSSDASTPSASVRRGSAGAPSSHGLLARGLVPWATVIGLGAGVIVFGALLLALRRPLGTGDGASVGNPVVSALRRSAHVLCCRPSSSGLRLASWPTRDQRTMRR